MASKTLFESVMWGTSKQVQEILDKRDLTFDDNYTDYALLLTALRRKRKEIAKILLSKGCRVVKKVAKNSDAADTPLHLAVKLGDADIVERLLGKGAAVDVVDQSGETALHFAMKKGCHRIVDLMLSAVDDDCHKVSNKDGLTHFHIACIRNNVEVVERFIVSSGVDVNCSVNFESQEWAGYTGLHFAVENKCLDTVKLLLSRNADPRVKSAEDKTPLHLAVQKQNDEIVDVILSSIGDKSQPTNVVDEDGLSHFHIACMKHHYEAVQSFLRQGVDINQAVKLSASYWAGYTALHFAVKGLSSRCGNQIAVIELLLKNKTDVAAKDKQGQTPLHLACLQSDEQISKLIRGVFRDMKTDVQLINSIFCEKLSEAIAQVDQVRIIKLLLDHKSNVNAKSISSETPIFYLYKYDRSKISDKCSYGDDLVKHVIGEFNKKRKEIVKLLLTHDADVNVQNDMGQSLLHLIANIGKALDDEHKEETAELLISRGANVKAMAKYGSTPLHLAAKNGHARLIELLLRHGADVNAYEASDQSTPLHLATSYQQVRAIEVLLENKADVTAVKSNGMNVLHIMAMINPDGSEEPDFIESYEKLTKTFVELGCDIDAQDINGRTPLHLASWDHNNAGIWSLLQQFADINVEDFAGETALAFPVNSTVRCINVYCIFKDFYNMLKLTGLHISKRNQELYAQRFEGVFLDGSDNFLSQCTQEIDRMKTVWINNHTSLYDIMFKSPHEMVVYAGNDAFKEVIEASDFESRFDIYRYLLKAQFRRGLQRKTLLTNAKESLEFMIGMGLPDSCSDKIFQYLSNKCLSDVVKAKTVSLARNANNKIEVQRTPYDPNDCKSLEKALAYCKNLFDRQMEMDIT